MAVFKRGNVLKRVVRHQAGKAYSPEEKARLLEKAKEARSPGIYTALMLALNAGIGMPKSGVFSGGRVDLSKASLTAGESKTEAGEGRTIPLNSALLEAVHQTVPDDQTRVVRLPGAARQTRFRTEEVA